MKYLPRNICADITKDYRIPERYMNVLESRIANDRAKAEERGGRKGLSIFAYTPFTKHHYALMVARTIEWSKQNHVFGNDEEYINGMVSGWLVGFHPDRDIHPGRTLPGYSYVEGKQAGSRLFHWLEASSTYQGDIVELPKYLLVDTQQYIDRGIMWHIPAWCEECSELLNTEERIVGRLDGDEDDADERFMDGLRREIIEEFEHRKKV